MNQIIELIVDKKDADMRIDAYLRSYTELSRSRISTLMLEGALCVDGVIQVKPSFRVEAGQKLELSIPEVRPVAIEPQNIPIDILYQDTDMPL